LGKFLLFLFQRIKQKPISKEERREERKWQKKRRGGKTLEDQFMHPPNQEIKRKS